MGTVPAAGVTGAGTTGWLEEAQEWFSSSSSRFSRWKAETSRVVTENQVLKDQNSELQKDVEILRSSTLMQSLTLAHTQISENLAVMGQLQDDLNRLEKEKGEWLSERAAMMKDRVALQTESSTLRRTVETVIKERDQLHQENTRLAEEKSILLREKDVLATERSELLNEKIKLSASIDALRTKLKGLIELFPQKIRESGAAVLAAVQSQFKNFDASIIKKGFRHKTPAEEEALTSSMEELVAPFLETTKLDRVPSDFAEV
ncbi:hypothetical protein ACP70R_004818 [Stipagrostis hirtigluma subsp. patula]